jgi:1,4-alpha-glucan branching enzyme
LLQQYLNFRLLNEPITVRFDASKGDAGLLGYSGRVFAHTGVTVNGFRWRNVIGDWGNDSNQPELTQTGQNTYQFVIEPNIHEFYNVSESDDITEISFVFRSEGSDGPTGRGVNGADIFVDVYSSGISAVLISPTYEFDLVPDRVPYFAPDDQVTKIEFASVAIETQISSLTLFENNVQVAQSSTTELTYDFDPSQKSPGLYNYVCVAEAVTGQTDSSTLLVMLNPEPNSDPPPAGTLPGINIKSPTVTLSLFAPGKDFVYLIGDFNDWTISTEYLMNKYESADTTIFWLTLDGISTTSEVAFQYFVDGEIIIADPYSEKVLNQEDDEWIPSSVYPNLKEYPADKTIFSVSVFQVIQDEYQWEVENFERPAVEDLVIYELLVRDFVSTHSYKTLIDTLSYFEKLGVNAIQLMPVMEFDGNSSWGYNPAFMFALDKYYGTKNDFKRFIDECHKRGIAVILDIVHNHHYGQSPFVRLYNEGGYGRPTSDNPWFNVESPNQVFSFGYDLDHEAQVTKNLIDRINRYWIEEYNIDGYRFDFTKGMTNTPGDGGGFDQSRIDILKRMADKIWEVDPESYVILEHFAPDSEEKILTDYGMLVWGNHNYNYSEATMGYHESNKSNFSRMFWKNRNGYTGPYIVGYMESHDEERVMFKSLEFGNSSGDYNVKDLSTALDRVAMSAAFFFTIPGPKMIWQFGELGYDFSIDFNGRVGEKPIRWDYYRNQDRLDLFKTFAALIDLKKNYEAFKTDDVSMSVSSSVKRINLNHWSMNVTVIGNFDVVNKTVVPNFQTTGIWYDYFSADSIEVNDVAAGIELKPGEFHIYTSKKLPQPDIVISSVEEDAISSVTDYSLGQNYPNPFNPNTTISYSIKQAGDVSLIVYDVLGREVTTLVNEPKSIGKYSVNFDGSNLTSGIYFYTIRSESFTQTKKLVLIK